MYSDSVKKSLEGKYWTEIGKYPVKWVVADPKMDVIYKAHMYDFDVTVAEDGKEEQKSALYFPFMSALRKKQT